MRTTMGAVKKSAFLSILFCLAGGLALAHDRDGRRGEERREEMRELREERREERRQRRLKRFERMCEGIKMMMQNEDGSVQEFVLPIRNPKALKHWKKWATKHGCPSTEPDPGTEPPPPPPPNPPMAFVISDMNGASETIANERGMMDFFAMEGGNQITLGRLFLGPHASGQIYVDGDSSSSPQPLAAMTVADYAGTGDINILPGETISIVHDGGINTTFTFLEGVNIPSGSGAVIYVGTINGEGRFFADEALTDPL